MIIIFYIISHHRGVCKQEVAKAGLLFRDQFPLLQLTHLPAHILFTYRAGVAGSHPLVGIAAVGTAPDDGLFLFCECTLFQLLQKLGKGVVVHTLYAGDLQPQPRCRIAPFTPCDLRKAGIGIVMLMEFSGCSIRQILLGSAQLIGLPCRKVDIFSSCAQFF